MLFNHHGKIIDTIINIDMSYHIYDHLAQRLPLLFAKVLEDVTIVLLQKLKAYSQVVVLQHRRVVVHQRQL